jgi:predicted PolB exonuclease-like 3'-5' exonuclease
VQPRHQHLLVFDLETVPDTHAAERLLGNRYENDEERRAALDSYQQNASNGRSPFLNVPLHRIVAIGVLHATITATDFGESYALQNFRCVGQTDWDEVRLIRGFLQRCDELRPRLVTFNGRGFDLPVLRARALVHDIPAPWLYQSGDKWSNYNVKYAPDWHCDLQEMLTDYGAASRSLRLAEVCAALGLPGKLSMSGAKVADQFAAGQLNRIRDYCETDVLNTWLIYLKLQHHRGTLEPADYQHSLGQLRHALRDRVNQGAQHYEEFLTAWPEAVKAHTA